MSPQNAISPSRRWGWTAGYLCRIAVHCPAWLPHTLITSPPITERGPADAAFLSHPFHLINLINYLIIFPTRNPLLLGTGTFLERGVAQCAALQPRPPSPAVFLTPHVVITINYLQIIQLLTIYTIELTSNSYLLQLFVKYLSGMSIQCAIWCQNNVFPKSIHGWRINLCCLRARNSSSNLLCAQLCKVKPAEKYREGKICCVPSMVQQRLTLKLAS